MSRSESALEGRRRAMAAVEYVNNNVMFSRAAAWKVERASWPVAGVKRQKLAERWRRRAGAGSGTHSNRAAIDVSRQRGVKDSRPVHRAASTRGALHVF